MASARLVACPGCYPTSVQLGLIPLLARKLVDPDHLIASAASGVSGAGRQTGYRHDLVVAQSILPLYYGLLFLSPQTSRHAHHEVDTALRGRNNSAESSGVG